MNPYAGPMQPYPGLEPFTRTLRLPRNGLDLHLYDAGPRNGTPVVLVHGLGDEADTWRHLISPLAQDRRVLAFDLPGFGRSQKPDIAYTLPFFSDVLLELLDCLEFKQAFLVGHSLGAAIVHSTALERPERVERLALISGGLAAKTQKLNLHTLLFLLPGLGEWLYNRLRRDPQAAYRSLEPYYTNLDSLPEDERDFLFRRVNERVWSDGQRRAFLSTLRNLARWLPAQMHGLSQRLAALHVPTVVLWGECDQISPVENGRLLVELQRSARLALVPEAGHNLQQERPDAVIEAIMGG